MSGAPTTDPGSVDPVGLSGPAAPPRANGELVFTAPWQSRLFAATMALRERDVIDGERFRQGLIAAIADHTAALEREGAVAEAYDYWGCWQRALERLLAETGLVADGALGRRSRELSARPHGHDHRHHHDDDHGHEHGGGQGHDGPTH
ncbi:MAG: nitrile hydratase accessory protein [Actinomycetota bacterium]